MILNNYAEILKHLFIQRRASMTSSSIIYHYHVFKNISKRHLPVKKIAFYFTHETSPYECSIINQAILECERIMEDKPFSLEYYAYPLSTSVSHAQDIIIAATKEHEMFDVVVPISDYVALACRDTEEHFEHSPNYIFACVINGLESGVTDILGEKLKGSTAVLAERPSEYPILHFMSEHAEHIKRVLVPHDEHSIPSYGRDRDNNFTNALENFGYPIERLPIFSGNQKRESALNHIKSFDAVVINDDSTTSRAQVKELVRLCADTKRMLISADATSVFLGASIGFGNPGDMYGIPVAHKIAQSIQGMSLDDIKITRITEDSGLCFNSDAIKKQGVPLSDAAHAALNAKNVEEKYEETKELLAK